LKIDLKLYSLVHTQRTFTTSVELKIYPTKLYRRCPLTPITRESIDRNVKFSSHDLLSPKPFESLCRLLPTKLSWQTSRFDFTDFLFQTQNPNCWPLQSLADQQLSVNSVN